MNLKDQIRKIMNACFCHRALYAGLSVVYTLGLLKTIDSLSMYLAIVVCYILLTIKG